MTALRQRRPERDPDAARARRRVLHDLAGNVATAFAALRERLVVDAVPSPGARFAAA